MDSYLELPIGDQAQDTCPRLPERDPARTCRQAHSAGRRSHTGRMGCKTNFRQPIKPNTAPRQPCAWPYAYDQAPEIVTAVVEIPQDSVNKYEYDPNRNRSA